jgi:hypothetical protein
MFDLTQIRVAGGKFVCNILPHKNLGRSRQHLMMEATRTRRRFSFPERRQLLQLKLHLRLI